MKSRFNVSVLFFVVVLFMAGPAGAFEVGDFDATAFFRNQSYLRLGGSEDELMQCRNEFNLEVAYNKIPHLSFFVQLRPFYDLVYDWSNEGTGGYAGDLRDGWAHNLGRNDDRDPLIREAFVDFTSGNVEARIGRQLVSWGKSDGIYMLDVINPFNYRNLSEFNEEDVKIPQWMVNFNYAVGPGSIQLLYIPWFTAAAYPGQRLDERGHDWMFNVVSLGNEVVGVFDDIFKNEFGIPEGYPVDREDPAKTLDNGEFGVRWSGFGKGISYTLNAFYTWTDFWNDHPNTGEAATATAIKRRADRLTVLGFSVDRYFETGSFVLRLETAYTKGQPFVLPDTNLEEKDQIGYMLGYDRWIMTDWLLSFQLWQNYILNASSYRNPYIGLGANKFDWDTFQIANGQIDSITTQTTAYISHDGFFPGDTGHLELFLLYGADGYWWNWNRFRYDYNNNLSLAVGLNFYWGPSDSMYGQFHNNDNVFFEIKYSFN